MNELTAPVLSLAIAIPFAAALWVWRTEQIARARSITAGALGLSMLLSCEGLREVLRAHGALLHERWISRLFGSMPDVLAVDGLSAALMVLFPALALVCVVAAPRRDSDKRFLLSALVIAGATLTTYSTHNLAIFFAGWLVSVLPFLIPGGQAVWPEISRTTVLASLWALALAAFVSCATAVGAGVADPLSFAALAQSNRGVTVLGGLLMAAVLRTGVFPGHRGVAASMAGGGLLLSTLLMNSHQGLYVLARLVLPAFRASSGNLMDWLCIAALFSSLYVAVLGLAEKKPEGLLATVFISQATGLFAGLTTETAEGVTGALLQWVVLAVCSTSLMVVYRCLYARTDGMVGRSASGTTGFLGLASRTPRFAVIFAISALALAGMPGTLGFSGEDLLMHGALAAHGWLGAILPVSIALNAYHVFRLFARLFMGEQVPALREVRDGLPRERWMLFASILVLVWLGLFPSHAVQLREQGTRTILGER